MSYRDLKAIVSNISKRKPIPAIVVDVLGSKCAVRLSGNGGLLTNLTYSGGVPVVGQSVNVDYSRGYPFVSTSDGLSRTIAPIIATNRPVSSAVQSAALNSIEKQPTRYGNMIYRDDWEAETAYLANDLVFYASSVYLCILDSTGNTPYDQEYWTALGGGGGGPMTDAENDFQVGDGVGAWIKKSLAEIRTILGVMPDAESDSNYYGRSNGEWKNITWYTDQLYQVIGAYLTKPETDVLYTPLSSMSIVNSAALVGGGATTLHTHAYSGIIGVPTIRELLTAARTYYVRTDGNDTNTGLANTSGGAFLTIQKAVDTITTLDIAGFTVTVQIADGTYTTPVILKNVVGFSVPGNLVIKGNNTTPSNVIISTTAASAFSKGGDGSVWDILDLKITTTTSGNGISSQSGANLRFANINFGSHASSGVHLLAKSGGKLFCIGNYFVSGGGYIHVWADYGGLVDLSRRTITFSNSPAFSYFAIFAAVSILVAYEMIFTNGGTVTGTKYIGYLNGVVQTNAGITYFPGTIAGSLATGAQYA